MSDVNQDDIDKLLQDALSGGDPATPAEPTGAASQDDIDALFAAIDSGDVSVPEPAPPSPAPEAAAPEPEIPDQAEDEPEYEGVANQDDIDALFAAVGSMQDAASQADTAAPAQDETVAEIPPPAATAEAADLDLDGVAGQDDIDALFSAMSEGDTAVDHTATVDAMTDEEAASVSDTVAEAAPEDDDTVVPVGETADLDELLSSLGDDVTAPETGGQSAEDTERVDDFDMDALLKQVAEAAPPPPIKAPPPVVPENAETAVLDMNSADVHRVLADAGHSLQTAPAITTPEPAAQPAPVQPPPAATLPAASPQATEPRREFSVLQGAGEVESIANQVSGMIASLSEKARSYMQAWMAADCEARELRSRALAEERRRSSLTSEKEALAGEVEELRQRLGELEGGKMAWEESRRTLETSFQAKIRELESQVKLLGAEAESLKDELTRARNQATGVDIESRRARFEVDRLKAEAESERMERLRIQRALENREKEIQAMQSQAAGQASSLFIDELHRLVRRLETELEARSSGAHEALKQLDRLEAPEDMVPVVANLRAALMQALGADDDPDDAIKALGREASGVKGPAAIAPAKTEMVSFETAIATYNLSGAIDVAGALLRDARATPGLLMRKVYQCPALRRPEIVDYLADLSRLLEGLRTVQESSDRARGKETGESEVFYVQMFDFLHNLVRMKLVSRMSGDIWRLFLDLRGRFSFVTSDKQWAEYRDGTLKTAQ